MTTKTSLWYRGEAKDAGLGGGVVLERESGRQRLVDQVGVEDVELVALKSAASVSAMDLEPCNRQQVCEQSTCSPGIGGECVSSGGGKRCGETHER